MLCIGAKVEKLETIHYFFRVSVLNLPNDIRTSMLVVEIRVQQRLTNSFKA